MEQLVLVGLVALLALAHHGAGHLSRASRRRREARALRLHLVHEITSGRHSPDDELVEHVLAWCDEVARSGRDIRLTAG